MSAYILILTMAYSDVWGMTGSITTARFKTQAACESAGKEWLDRFKAINTFKRKPKDFYLCVAEEEQP